MFRNALDVVDIEVIAVVEADDDVVVSGSVDVIVEAVKLKKNLYLKPDSGNLRQVGCLDKMRFSEIKNGPIMMVKVNDF